MTRQTKAYIALAFVCIVWGTTYLAIRIGVMHYPAFLFAGVRQVVSGIILAAVALMLNRKTDFSRANILRQMTVGFLMLTVGNGCVTWGEKYIPSGVAALICSMMPLFAVMFNLLSSKRDKLNGLIGTGLVLGVCGVGLIFRQNLADIGKPAYIGGMAATLLATCSWALGSILNRKNVNPVNALLNSAMQLLFGGLVMLLISPVIDDYSGLVLWNTDGVISLVYLIIFGSVLAYAAYMYALAELPVGIATIYAYINPLIAVLAGYLFLSEQLNIYTALSFATIVVSVYLVNLGYRRQHQANIKSLKEQGSGFPKEAAAKS
ncbi:MAG: EamA family transporter [Bacteroidota bacterium]